MKRCGLFIVVVTLASLSLDGQVGSSSGRYDAGLFSALRWRNIGPDRGGRSIAVAGSPSRPYEYYAGAVGGGLWKTTDAGTTWRPVTDGQIKSSSIGAVAVSQSNPDVVYLGMGEVQVQRNMLQGDGVYKSTDAGKTWTHLGLTDTHVISRVVIHPTNPDLVYVAAFGHFYGPNEERGVYRSKDGGKSWQKILFRDNRSGGVDLAMARENADILFAAIWQAAVAPGAAVSSGGPGSGLFKSTNGGETWTEITRNAGLPSGTIGKIGVAIAGSDANCVYALIEADGGGVFRSDDGGATWTKLNEQGALRQRPSYFNRIYADPKDKHVVYVLNFSFFKSTDGARTFQAIQTPHPDHHDLWIAPNDSRRMIHANDGGPTVSVNGGESWTGQAIPTAQLYRVATTEDVPYHVCGAQQDQSAICVPSSQTPWRSVSPFVGTGVGAGRLGGPIYAPGGGEFGMIAPHPRDPDLFFATGPSVITRYDRRTGLSTTRDIQVSPVAGRGPDRERFSLYALAFSHHDPNVLYTASQHLWRTQDGLNWEKISPDLSRPGAPASGRRAGGSISATAPSYHDANTIWVGTDDGLVHITRDGGKTWQKITPPELPQFSRISLIEASPNKAGTAYVAAKRFELDDRGPYIFRTDDYGSSWKKIVNGVPPNDFVNVVREDPKRAGLLYAGTDHTVFASFDDGANWQSLALNLPDTSVSDLIVETNDLVIATQGRSFYVLDDIGPLRELSRQVTDSALYLFTPRDTIRRLNLPVIDYVLKEPVTNVVIEILDDGGKAIRTYTSSDELEKHDEEGGARPPTTRPSGKPGLNRFTWDLRSSRAAIFPGLVMWVGTPDGPIVPPGKYQVRVRAAGETRTQPLNVVRDPRRADLTDADLQAQFDLALKARDGIHAAHEAVSLIRKVKQQVQDRVDKAKDSQITSAGESLSNQLSAIEGELYQVKLRSPLDATTYPPMLNQHFANLKLSIETGDGRPTRQAYAAFERLSSELNAHLAKLNEVLKTEIASFNRLLTDRKLVPVATSQ